MTLSQAASSSTLVLLLLCQFFLSTGAYAERPELVVPATTAPKLDGRLDDAVWAKAAVFEPQRDNKVHGTCRLLRAGRQLYVGYDSIFTPLSLGLRLHFADPRTKRRIAVLIAPLEMPKAPLTLWLEKGGAPAIPIDASRADVRFDFNAKEGFTFEARLPLDLLEIGRPKNSYLFGAELWDTEAGRVLSFYPVTTDGATTQQGAATLSPAEEGAGAGSGDWGSDVGVEAAPSPNPALVLLQKIAAEKPVTGRSAPRTAPVMAGYFGLRDGRRLDAPLAKLEVELRALIEQYPDYASLRANLVRVLVGRNQYTAAFDVMRALRVANPSLNRNERQTLVEMQLLRDAGEYDNALALLEKHKPLLQRLPVYAREKMQLTSLRQAWKHELSYRAADSKRDDLPRVRIDTDRGSFVLELFEDDAPNAVANFVTLAGSGFYDGTRFHWSSSGGSTIGGDPNSRDNQPFNNGFGDPGFLIESEPSRRLNFPGTIAFVSKRRREHTEGCIFSLNMAPAPDRDGRDSVFGRVIEGFDVVRSIGFGDTIKSTKVLRKRDHPYKVVKRPKS